jgi:hypothetical protein
VTFKVEESIRNFGLKRIRGQFTFVQSYRIGNLFPNPVYVDDILLVSSDVNLLHEKKKLLSSRFNKIVLGEMYLVIKIKIHLDRRKEY